MKKDLVDITDYTKEKILYIIDNTLKFKKNPNRELLKGNLFATLFFEPSTRTRISFESAINRLGGRIVGFSDPTTTSSTKGESLKDTIVMVSNYVDLIIMRHYLEGTARYASEISNVPIINAGDGANQHPTQTLLDLFTINETQNRLDNLNITIVGDLKYGRAVHSLIYGLSHFNPHINFVAPQELKIPDQYKTYCKNNNISYNEFNDFSQDSINSADILYMTRIQKERFTDMDEYEKVKDVYTLTNSMIKNSKDNLKILHPLPRVNEINEDVDSNPKAYYFNQARNGMFVRQAVICDIMGISNID